MTTLISVVCHYSGYHISRLYCAYRHVMSIVEYGNILVMLEANEEGLGQTQWWNSSVATSLLEHSRSRLCLPTMEAASIMALEG